MSTIFISIKHVMQLHQLKFSAAQRRLAKIRTAFGLDRYVPVTIIEYCKFNRLEVDFVMQVLDPVRKKPF